MSAAIRTASIADFPRLAGGTNPVHSQILHRSVRQCHRKRVRGDGKSRHGPVQAGRFCCSPGPASMFSVFNVAAACVTEWQYESLRNFMMSALLFQVFGTVPVL